MTKDVPIFNNKKWKDWLSGYSDTSKFIRTFWEASTKKQKRDINFLIFLTKCGWGNAVNGEFTDTTKKWRNENLATYLKVQPPDATVLTKAIHKNWPKISEIKAKTLLKPITGLTDYYKSFRPGLVQFMENNPSKIRYIFGIVSSKLSTTEKIKKACNVMDKMQFRTPNSGKTSVYNGLTPVLACLDPSRKFPIMNQRTETLLRTMDQEQNISGALKLVEFIQPRYNMKNAFELDIWAQNEKFPKDKRASKHYAFVRRVRDIGLKPESDSIANINRQKRRITKKHNKLINDFKRIAPPHWTVGESNFDILVENWKPRTRLLIEAKTSSSGSDGRTQIRMAIGQLFDYRHTCFEKEKIALAILLPKRPDQNIVDLLQSLKIHTLYLKKENIKCCSTNEGKLNDVNW